MLLCACFVCMNINIANVVFVLHSFKNTLKLYWAWKLASMTGARAWMTSAACELINDNRTPCCRQRIHKDCLVRCAGACPLCRSVVTMPTPEIPTPTFGGSATVRLQHDSSYGLGGVRWDRLVIPGSYALYPEEAQPSGCANFSRVESFTPVLELEIPKPTVSR